MAEKDLQRSKPQFDERYLGLSRAEVALREKMAKKFGRQAKHLDATSQPAAGTEESKAHGVSQSSQHHRFGGQQEQVSSSIKVLAQPRLDPSTKLRQLQEDNEKYRASIESGHMHM